MHEHLAIKFPGMDMDPLAKFEREGPLKAAVQQLLQLKGKEVATVVDATPITLGRDADLLMRAAEATGMNVIAATGFYTRRMALPDYFAAMDVDGLAAIMEYEITKGIRGTTAKAGVIKVASGVDRIVKSEERVLRAAARVSRSTGSPIITHTDVGTLGPEQLDVLESEGADLSHVVIGHTCCNSDIKYYLDVVRRDAYLGFDRIGWDIFQSDDVRLVAIAGLIAAGHANRLVLSQDAVVVHVGGSDSMPLLTGSKPLVYLDEVFIPRLLKGGVTQDTVKQILVDNPRHIFER
jgi:phosphotriesterase-related protein